MLLLGWIRAENWNGGGNDALTMTNERKNVIIVRSRATDPTVEKFARSLSKNGFSVELLLWNRLETPLDKTSDGYSKRVLNFRTPQDRIQAVFFFPIWWIYEFFFLLRRDTDVIHAYDLDTLPPAVLIKLLKRKKLFYSIGDFYANNLPEGSFGSAGIVIREFVARIERTLARFADALFLVDETRVEELGGSRTSNVHIIYNSPPDCCSDGLCPSNNGKEELVIFYAGVISKQRGLDYMIDAVEKMKNAKLLIAGTGPYVNRIKERASKSVCVEYLGWLRSYEDVIKLTQRADLLFRFSDPRLPKTKYESPNKLFEAMMCGKPIIVTDNSSMADIVRKEQCGIVVPYGDVKAIETALSQLADDEEMRDSLGLRGRAAYEEKYSWSIMEERLLGAYRDTCK